MTDAEDAIAQRLHGELGAVDLREDGRIHHGSVRDARGEARRRRLLGARHAELARHARGRPPCRPRPRAGDGRRRARPQRSAQGASRRRHPRSRRRERPHTGAGRESDELVVEFRLAVVAAVATVRAVALTLELGGRDRLVAIPIALATPRAPSSSPVASAGDTAVTASARSPRARAASAATSDESTPPENATTQLPTERILVSSSAVRRHGVLGAAARASAHTDFTERPVDLASAAQSSCSGARLTTRPSRRPTFTRTCLPRPRPRVRSRSSS